MQRYGRIITLACCLSLAACGNAPADQPKPIVPANSKAEVFTLQKQVIATAISLPAELSSFRQVDLYAKISSYVKSLKVDIGADVREGQLLVELEAPEISSQLAAAESRLHAQQAVYTASSGTYQRLLETSKVEGTISKNDLDIALSKKDADLAQLEAARAAQKEIQIMQGYLQIRAPFAGKITARNVNTGAFVGQGAQTPLLILQEQKKLRLSVFVPEAYSGYLKVGSELGFRVVSLPGETFKANISRMSGALDPKLRSERAELDVANAAGKLLPGMVAEVSLPLKSRNTSFTAPRTAVLTTSEGIFVVKSVHNTARRIPVVLGLEAGDQVEIFSDLLQLQDTLVTRPNEKMREGAAIN